MCDTILATPTCSDEGFMLFGKNSDRQRNEAQAVEYFAGAEHGPGATLKCTYIEIPQVRRTHTVLLCRPFWIWGAEMGANDHGVVVGNEGLYARSPPPEAAALIGMDLLRLALERASTAAQAVDVVTTLLERHGQGGNCGHTTPSYYNNGFMIADAREAFVLETVGREWLVERVQGVRAISNRYSIDRMPLRVSAGLPALVRDSGWSDESEPRYADAITDPNKEHIGNAGARSACSTSLLNSLDRQVSVRDMMSILRDHGSGHQFHPQWRAECAVRRTLCMHAGTADRPGQTVGSMVSELRGNGAVHWVTGTAAPCMAVFKPVLMNAALPGHGPLPNDRFDLRTLWWRHERLHRAALSGDFAGFLDAIRPERDALEADSRSRVRSVMGGGTAAECSRVVGECWKAAMELEDQWLERVDHIVPAVDSSYATGWEQMNRLAGMEPFIRS